MSVELILAIAMVVLIIQFGVIILIYISRRNNGGLQDIQGAVYETVRGNKIKEKYPHMDASYIKTEPVNVAGSVREIRRVSGEKTIIGVEIDSDQIKKFEIGMPFNLVGEQLVENRVINIDTPPITNLETIKTGQPSASLPEKAIARLFNEFGGSPTEETSLARPSKLDVPGNTPKKGNDKIEWGEKLDEYGKHVCDDCKSKTGEKA